MRKIILALLIFCSGCATVNFSSKYYTLPQDYETDIQSIWNEFVKKVPLRNSYFYKISKDNESKPAGIPCIKDKTIYLPEYYIKYLYEFYRNDRTPILWCIFAHEISHTEYQIPAEPLDKHYACDITALNNILLPYSPYNVNHYYSSFKILSDYWYARKGVGGHAFNIGWNALNLCSIALGGAGMLGDLYEVDANARLNSLLRDYPTVKFIFTRSDKVSKSNASSNSQVVWK